MSPQDFVVQRVARSFLGQVMTSQPCAACHGFGTVIPEPCVECAGEGRVRSRRTVGVDVPAGVDTGTRIRLTAQGEADSLQSPEGEALYRACTSTGHHHHLICRSCGLTVEIEATDVEQWAKRTAERHGFRDAEHVVDIFGLCGSCQQSCQRESKRGKKRTWRLDG